jgi:hypothetical protein
LAAVVAAAAVKEDLAELFESIVGFTAFAATTPSFAPSDCCLVEVAGTGAAFSATAGAATATFGTSFPLAIRFRVPRGGDVVLNTVAVSVGRVSTTLLAGKASLLFLSPSPFAWCCISTLVVLVVVVTTEASTADRLAAQISSDIISISCECACFGGDTASGCLVPSGGVAGPSSNDKQMSP